MKQSVEKWVDYYSDSTGEEDKRKRQNLKEIIIFLLILLVMWLAIFYETKYVYGFIVVDGDSMNNTMYNGQVGIIQKFHKDEVKAGDIVVFYSDELEEYLIKRCVAVGGDTISMDQGVLTVNGKVVKEDYIKEPMVEDDHIDEMTIPENCIYAMGDNRNDSYDCRFLGPVPMKEFTGVLKVNLGKYGITKNRVLITFAILLVLFVAVGFYDDVIRKKKNEEEENPVKEKVATEEKKDEEDQKKAKQKDSE